MPELPGYIKISVNLLSLLIIIILLYLGKFLLIPFSFALFLTFLLLPVSVKLHSWGIHRGISIVLSIILAIIVFFALIFFIYSQVMSFSDDLPQLRQSITQKLTGIQDFIYEKFKVDEQKQLQWVRQRLDSTMASSGAYISGVFTFTGNILAAFGLIPLYIFFLTYYRDKFKIFIKKMTAKEHHEHVLSVVQRSTKVSQKYLQGILIDVIILSVLNSTGFLILGIKHAILFGVIASLLNIIPYIGVLIGSLFPIAMALLTKDSMWYAVGAAGICIFVQFLDNNFITPTVVGRSVSINPLATIIALLIGGMVWGIPGMILFIPLLGALKVIFDNFPSLQPYGYLIGEEGKMKPLVSMTRFSFSKKKIN